MKRNRLTIALVLGLLVLGVAGAALAEEAEAKKETSLSGTISATTSDQFILIESESGGEVALRGSEDDLAEHLGSSVKVIGHWAEDDDGGSYFAVSTVEVAEA